MWWCVAARFSSSHFAELRLGTTLAGAGSLKYVFLNSSSLSLLQLLQSAHDRVYTCCFADCSAEEALEAASLHPASTVGISDCKGRLAIGYDADLVVLDKDLHVVSTLLAGKKVWSREGVEAKLT